MIHPEFPPTTSTRIAAAVLALLAGDSALAEYCEGGIQAADTEDLLLLGTFSPPLLAVAIGAHSLEPEAGECQQLTQEISILLFTPARDGDEPCDWLRARVVGHVETLLQGNQRLKDADGPMVDELLAFSRSADARTSPDSAYVLTVMTAIYQGIVDYQQEYLHA